MTRPEIGVYAAFCRLNDLTAGQIAWQREREREREGEREREKEQKLTKR